MKTTNTLSSLLSGVTGEYFVAAELSKRGYIASITLRNTKGMDILCSNESATKTVGIQVKTNRGSKRDWILNQKAEDYFADNLFYAFVNLHDNERSPEYFIVPSKTAALFVKEGHASWLSSLGKNGRIRKDGPMRHFMDKEEKYLNRFDLLEL